MRAHPDRGMTLVEISVALALAALMLAIAVPALSSVTRAQLRQKSAMSEEDRERLELAGKSAFTASADVPKTELGGSVKFTDVWVQHQPERYTTGKSFLYFWSSGLTEEASIHVAQGGDVYSLLVSPLTGRVKVVGEREDAPGQRR